VTWKWVILSTVLAIHDEQLAEHGGLPGVRDMGLLESAMSRPQNLAAYGDPQSDIAALASAYAFGIAKNHPFIDGNKRVSAVVTRLFLRLNGHDFTAPEANRLRAWLELAAGNTQEPDFAQWVRENIAPTKA
jgi:death on curing protein